MIKARKITLYPHCSLSDSWSDSAGARLPDVAEESDAATKPKLSLQTKTLGKVVVIFLEINSKINLIVYKFFKSVSSLHYCQEKLQSDW